MQIQRLFVIALMLSSVGGYATEPAPGSAATSPPDNGATVAAPGTPLKFLEEFPHLKSHVFREPETHFRFGIGASPVQMMKNKAGVSLNVFEIHYARSWIDWNVLTASYGMTVSGDSTSKINAFTFRSAPKIRFTEMFSLGPLVGYELISFPEVSARLRKDTWFTPVESFSAQGLIFGGVISETLPFGKDMLLKLSQVAYRQTYDPDGTEKGWTYYYTNDALNRSKEPIEPGWVFMVEVSVLY